MCPLGDIDSLSYSDLICLYWLLCLLILSVTERYVKNPPLWCSFYFSISLFSSVSFCCLYLLLPLLLLVYKFRVVMLSYWISPFIITSIKRSIVLCTVTLYLQDLRVKRWDLLPKIFLWILLITNLSESSNIALMVKDILTEYKILIWNLDSFRPFPAFSSQNTRCSCRLCLFVSIEKAAISLLMAPQRVSSSFALADIKISSLVFRILLWHVCETWSWISLHGQLLALISASSARDPLFRARESMYMWKNT